MFLTQCFPPSLLFFIFAFSFGLNSVEVTDLRGPPRHLEFIIGVGSEWRSDSAGGPRGRPSAQTTRRSATPSRRACGGGGTPRGTPPGAVAAPDPSRGCRHGASKTFGSDWIRSNFDVGLVGFGIRQGLLRDPPTTLPDPPDSQGGLPPGARADLQPHHVRPVPRGEVRGEP